jgi:hypothetical protein
MMTDEADNKAGNDLTPEQKAEAARQLKKLLLGDEPGDDGEVFYYLSPFPEDSEATDEPDEPDEEGDAAK